MNTLEPTQPSSLAGEGVVPRYSAEEIASWTPKRRGFLKMLGVTGGLAALGPLAGCSSSEASSTSSQLRTQLLANAQFWTDVQNRFVLNPARLFMNIGTAGSMPRMVLDKFAADNLDYAVESRSGYTNFLAQRTAIARGTGTLDGAGYGVDPDELVVSYNTSDGMCHAILGIAWERGDCVITTNQEHPGGDVPLAIARDRYGLIVRRVVLPVGNGTSAAGYADLFAREIDAARAAGQRVRALMWSSPTFLTGTMLPIRRIVDVAIAKSAGNTPIITICDGAHLPGMMAYNYAQLGVDFMAGAAHKWQCAPGSTGILIIRNKVRPQFNPLPLPAYFPVTTSSLGGTASATLAIDGRDAGAQKILVGTTPWASRAGSTSATAVFDIGGVIQSCGSKHVPLVGAVAEACRMWDELGRRRIETYILTLSSYTKARIQEIWGDSAALYCPNDDAELASALTCFDPFFGLPRGADAIASATISGNLVTRLSTEDNIVIRNTTVPTPTARGATTTVNRFPIRISTHLWHDPDDVDRALAAIRRIAVSLAG
jgi:selenocysteine lyase/cysteine desulfurase